MTSCIPIRVLLVYDGILQYSFGFGFYTPQVGTSWVQKHQKDSLLLNTQVLAGNFSCGCLSGSWNYRLRTLSRDSFQRVPRGIVLNALSVMTVCQCGHKLHRTASLSWINVWSCIACTSPEAVECSYYIPWYGKLATVSRHIFLSRYSSHQK